MFCPSLVIPASSRGSHLRAAEEKENLCSASALARSSWVGLALATSGRIDVVVVVVVGVVVMMGRSGLRLPPGALAGACRTSALRAVPRCLVGLVGRPWRRGLVDGAVRVAVTVGGGGRRTYAPPAVLSDLLGLPGPLCVVVGRWPLPRRLRRWRSQRTCASRHLPRPRRHRSPRRRSRQRCSRPWSCLRPHSPRARA